MASISRQVDVYETPSEGVTHRYANRQRAVTVIVALATIACCLATFLFVHGHASWVPYGDEYDIVPIVTGHEPLSIQWLWAPHNEHRHALPRLVRWCLITAAGGDFRSCVYAIPVLAGIGAVGAVVAMARIRGRSSLADIFFPLVVLHWGQVENLIWGFDLAIMLPVVLAIGVLFLGVWRPGIPDARVGFAASLGLLAILLCGGGGLLMAAPMSLWLAWATWHGLRSSQRGSQRALWCASAAMLILTWTLTLLYFHGIPRPPEVATAQTLLAKGQVTVAFLSTAFGMQFERFWWLTGGAMLLALCVAAVVAMKLAVRSEVERSRAFLLLTMVGGTLLMAVAVGHGRANSGVEGGLQSRYSTFLVPAWCALYLLASHLMASPRWVRIALVVAAMVTQANVQFGLNYAKMFWQRRVQFVQDLEAGTPSVVLAEKYHHPPFGLCFPSPVPLERWFTMLRTSKAPHFAGMTPSPRYERIDLMQLKPEEIVDAGGQRILRFTFPTTLDGSLLSMRMATRAGGRSNRVELRWRSECVEAQGSTTGNRDLPALPKDSVYVIKSSPGRVQNSFVPIAGGIRQLDIVNCTKGAKLLLGKATLLAIDGEMPQADASSSVNTAMTNRLKSEEASRR